MVDTLGFDYKRYQKRIIGHQEEIRLVDAHNAKCAVRQGGSKYHLHKEMGPCPFEGNLLTAKIILLLANPGFNKDLKPEDHLPRSGWGIANLSSQARRNWYRPRFKSLINHNDEAQWQRLSNSMAMIQLIPWASENYIDVQLPSRLLMQNTVQQLSEINHEALFVVMRRRKDWGRVLEQVNPTRIIFNPNPRCSYITKGNFKGDWQRIKDKLG